MLFISRSKYDDLPDALLHGPVDDVSNNDDSCHGYDHNQSSEAMIFLAPAGAGAFL